MAIKGVLFDSSGTLFRIEQAGSWLQVVLQRAGIATTEEELRFWAGRLEEAGALPGGAPPRVIPDARLFREACEAIGLAPQDVLMVGDDRRADGGAAELGCAVRLVDHAPVEERPAALRPVLDLVGWERGCAGPNLTTMSHCTGGETAASDDPPRRPRRRHLQKAGP